MKLSALAAALPHATCLGSQADPDITSITSDSRQVTPGALFVAYAGVSLDGHRFVEDAIHKGAAAVVGEVGAPPAQVSYVQVPNGRQALAHLCAAWHGFPARRLVMIGVTGTDGKTTTTNLIHSILGAAGISAGMISTVNAVIGGQAYDTGLHTTTPDAPDVQSYLAQMLQAGQTHCVLETTSHGLAQHRVDGCEFDVGVLTNITHEHLDIHGSFEAYRAAKARLFEMLAASARKGLPKTAVLNAGDPAYAFLRDASRGADFVSSYGLANNAQIYARDVAYRPDATRWLAVAPQGQFELQSRLVGEFNVLNALAAVGVGLALELPIEAIQVGVAAMAGVPGRMERIDEGQDFMAIVDFAHTPNSLEKALAAARQMTNGQVIVAFGAAGLRDPYKRGPMGQAAARWADKVVITAEDPRTESLDEIMAAIAAGCAAEGCREGQDFWRIADRAEALAFAVRLAHPGDVVIACGKGHEQSMCFGTTEYPWDDRRSLREALRR
ncbi:MAG: UDP-N-acetylmuramoyl-L-alanyl-D-glutamate--2,6-diaminopimelate ligase [Thermoflexales bacterium]|nr:UDP-N-acetylmuramoyl-L-alanyl-D-glutamate--2,6-diaminopimelate ligase [Thermoflexales bacterium]